MSDNHETTENKTGIANDIQETSMDSNPVNTASEQGSGKGSKDVIRIWPSLVVVLWIVVNWIFFYHYFPNSLMLTMLFLCVILFSIFCIVSSIVYLFKKKFKKSLSFILPGALIAFIIVSPWHPWYPRQISKKISSLRNYVSFLMHKKEVISDLNRLNWPEYKEWEFGGYSGGYTIIYDSNDEVIKKKYYRALLYEEHTFATFANSVDEDRKKGGYNPCFYTIRKIEGHFYIGTGDCL